MSTLERLDVAVVCADCDDEGELDAVVLGEGVEVTDVDGEPVCDWLDVNDGEAVCVAVVDGDAPKVSDIVIVAVLLAVQLLVRVCVLVRVSVRVLDGVGGFVPVAELDRAAVRVLEGVGPCVAAADGLAGVACAVLRVCV